MTKVLEVWTSSAGQRNHLWAVAWTGCRQSRRCISYRTRPVSWRESVSSGTHPRTKGARCFTGGHRHRTPSSPKGLLASCTRGQETLRITDCNHRSRGRRKRPDTKIPSSLQRWGPLDACRCRRWRHVGVAPLGAGPRLATAGERGRGRMFVASVRLGRAAPLTWGATFCTG